MHYLFRLDYYRWDTDAARLLIYLVIVIVMPLTHISHVVPSVSLPDTYVAERHSRRSGDLVILQPVYERLQ